MFHCLDFRRYTVFTCLDTSHLPCFTLYSTSHLKQHKHKQESVLYQRPQFCFKHLAAHKQITLLSATLLKCQPKVPETYTQKLNCWCFGIQQVGRKVLDSKRIPYVSYRRTFLVSTLISYTRFKYRSTCVKRGILSNQFFYFYDLLRRVPQFSRSRRGNCADIRMLQQNLFKKLNHRKASWKILQSNFKRVDIHFGRWVIL